MKTLIRLSLVLALVFMATSPPSAQSIGNPQTITVIDSGTACVTAPTACATFSVLGSNAVAFDVSGTWTGTLTFEGDASGGGIWRTILITNTADGTTATTTTANGTFSVGNAGFYSVRVRATAAVTGTAFVTATKGNLSAKLLTPSFSTATADVFCLNRSGQDIYIGRVAANDIGLYTGATACASGTLRFDVSSTAATFTVPILTSQIGGSSDTLIAIRNAGTDRWNFGSNGGFASALFPNADNAYDLGLSATRVRSGFFGTTVTAGTGFIAGGSTATSSQYRSLQSLTPVCYVNCGTAPTVAGTDSDMIVTMGASGVPASLFQVGFRGAWASKPTCQGQMALGTMAVGKLPMVIVTTTGGLTVTTNGVAPSNSDVYNISCRGTQ